MDYLIDKILSKDTFHLINIQTELLKSIHSFFYSRRINYVLPVILSSETDRLQDDVLECSISYYGQKLHLMKSMILQKQIALLNQHIKSLYTISPCIRLEKRDRSIKGRHAIEFQQLDIEFRDKSCEYVIDFVENLIVHIFSDVKSNCADDLLYFKRDITIPQAPFVRYDHHHCQETMGHNYELTLSKQNENLFWILNFDRWIYDKRITVDK